MSITALIIDDEQLAREELEYLLREEDDIDVLAQGRNGIEAVELIQSHHPDVVFLDVQMPGLDGFAVLKRLIELQKGRDGAPLPQIIFATAFDQYAVRAFDVNAIDYLLKPFDHSRVIQALDRVRRHFHDSPPREIHAVAGDEHSHAENAEPRDTGTRIEALLKLMEQQQAGEKRQARTCIRARSSCRHRAACCSSTRRTSATRRLTKAQSPSGRQPSRASPNAALWKNSSICSTRPSSGVPTAPM